MARRRSDSVLAGSKSGAKKQAAEDPTDGSVSSVTVPVSASARSSSLRHEAGLDSAWRGARWEATWCGSAHHRPGY